MRRTSLLPTHRSVLATFVAAAALAAPAPAAAAEPSTVAKRLADDPVFVERGARPTLSAGEAGAVRIRIAQKATGRIKVAVLKERDVKRVGTVDDYAQDVARELDHRGALLIVAGSERFVLTSYPDPNSAAAAVRRGVRESEGGSLEAQLVAIVDRLAENDPGAERDLNAPQAPDTSPPDVGPLIEVDTDGIAKVFAIVAGIVIGGIALIIGTVVLTRSRRHEKGRKRALAAARKQIGLLADDITALDLDTSMPGANAEALEAYHAGVTAYDEAQQKLAVGDPDMETIHEAMTRAAAGRGYLETAKQRFAAAAPGAGGTATP